MRAKFLYYEIRNISRQMPLQSLSALLIRHDRGVSDTLNR